MLTDYWLLPCLALAGSDGLYPVMVELAADIAKPLVLRFSDGSQLTADPIDLAEAVQALQNGAPATGHFRISTLTALFATPISTWRHTQALLFAHAFWLGPGLCLA